MSYYPNWDVEAGRLSKAFDIDIEVQFYWGPLTDGYALGPVDYPRIPSIILPGDFKLYISYDSELFDTGRSFNLINGNSSVSILIDWDGYVTPAYSSNPITQYAEFEVATRLAAGLLKLELFTPEVEAHLYRDVTAHQKMEWMLEYETKLTQSGRLKVERPKTQQAKDKWVGLNVPVCEPPLATSSRPKGLFQSMCERIQCVLQRS